MLIYAGFTPNRDNDKVHIPTRCGRWASPARNAPHKQNHIPFLYIKVDHLHIESFYASPVRLEHKRYIKNTIFRHSSERKWYKVPDPFPVLYFYVTLNVKSGTVFGTYSILHQDVHTICIRHGRYFTSMICVISLPGKIYMHKNREKK